MRTRLPSVVTLLLAFLVSAWGNVLAAAMCPHMRQDHACCHPQVAQNHTSHEMTGDMQMTPAIESAEVAAFAAADKPVEGCAHCMGRAPQSPPTVSLREVDRTNHGSELAAPTPASQPSYLAAPFTTSVPSREHSPPGASADRHVLISLFRI